MKPTLSLTLLGLLLAAPACREESPPSPDAEAPADAEADAEQATAEVGGVEIPINFGGKITRKERPLRTKRIEERRSKVIRTTDKSSPASMMILANGTITVDVCREGFDRRRRVDPETLKATLWIGGKSHRFELVAVDKTRDDTGRAFRFQAQKRAILCGDQMMLVVDVPNEAGDATEPATFVIPAGFEPY